MNDHDMAEFIQLKNLTLGERKEVFTKKKWGKNKKNKQKVKQTVIWGSLSNLTSTAEMNQSHTLQKET